MAEEKKTDTAQEKAVQDAIRQAEQAAADRKTREADASKENGGAADGKASQDADSGEIPVEDGSSAENTEEKSENQKDPAAGSDEDKKGFFGRKKDKEKEALKGQVADLNDKVRRQMAEFDNYRKRTEKEKDQMFSMGEKSVLEKLLPIVDNFERGLQTVPEDDKDDAFVQGMEKIYQQLTKQLKDLGVTPIEAEGKDFDPNFHNAVMQVDSDKLESGKVAQELQKGYMYHGTVLRHSMVSVVK